MVHSGNQLASPIVPNASHVAIKSPYGSLTMGAALPHEYRREATPLGRGRFRPTLQSCPVRRAYVKITSPTANFYVGRHCCW